MFQIGVLVVCMVGVTRAGWLDDLRSPKGLELSDGLKFHLVDTGELSLPAFQRYSLRADYAGYGISFGKSPETDAFQLALHVKDQNEGRGKDKKMMEMLIPAVLGLKATTVGAIMFTAIAALVMKALGVASVALVLALSLVVAKIFSQPHAVHPQHHLDFEAHGSEHHPVFAEFPLHETGGYVPHTEESANYMAYANYAQSEHEALAESQANFAVVQAPNGTSLSGVHQAAIAKRKDGLRRKKYSPPVLEVRKYTVTT